MTKQKHPCKEFTAKSFIQEVVKLTKRQHDIQAAQRQGYEDGYQQGERQTKEQLVAREKALQENNTQARLHMLAEVRGIAQAIAQLGEAAARLAMFEPRR